MQNHTKGILYASITALLWGFLAIALKVAVKEVNPHTIVWFRFVIAFVILSFWHAVYKPKELKILIRPPWCTCSCSNCVKLELPGVYAGDSIHDTKQCTTFYTKWSNYLGNNRDYCF